MASDRIDPARSLSACAAIALLLALAPGPGARPVKAAVVPVTGAPIADAQDRAPALELPADLVLHGGERFEIRWSQSGPAVDELEILLSIDGGRRFALRVSPELDARSGRYLWSVPDLASADARLRVRFDRGGREIDGPVSARFTLIAREREAGHGPRALASARDRELDLALRPLTDAEPDAAPEAQPVADPDDDFVPVHEGIWWTGMRGLDVPLPAGAFSRAGHCITGARELPAAGPLPDAPTAPRRVRGAGPRAILQPALRPTSSSEAPARLQPLRN